MGLMVLAAVLSLPMSMLPQQVRPHSDHSVEVVMIRDEDLVKQSCKIFWGLPEPRTTSAKDIASWSKRVKPQVSRALTLAAQAKKANKKWASFELDMVTFYGAVDLAQDSKYAFVFSNTPLVVKSMQNLSKTCASRR